MKLRFFQVKLYLNLRKAQSKYNLSIAGDYLITDCAYDTQNRKRPIFGGYSTRQEVCLSFVTYYPRIDLAGCYSMTPVKEFFETFGVYEFYSMNMTDVENMFLYSSNSDFQPLVLPQFSPGGEIDDENNKIAIEALKHAKEYTLVVDEDDQIYKQSILSKTNSNIEIFLI